MPHREGDDERNVLLNQMPADFSAYALDDTAMAKWATVMKLRQDVNGVLEKARADKRIGKALEAHVSLSGCAELAAELAAIDMTQDVATVRNEVIRIMQTYCGGSTDLVAQLAAEFYDRLRELELGVPMGALALSGRVPEATEESVRAFAQKLVDGKPEQFVTLCLERLDYECKVAASQTVLNNGNRDRVKPRYARVPTGSETCDFCLMLASRGFVYHTEATAKGEHGVHAHCRCIVVPGVRGVTKIEGYDPDALYDQWQSKMEAKSTE
jgi:hypothetical protein